MNQREAIVTIIDFVREQAPEDKRILKAVVILEKRADLLRARAESRITPPPSDLMEEPVTVTAKDCVFDLSCSLCRCGKKKERKASHCPACYRKVTPSTRKALWLPIGEGYEQAFSRSLRELGLPTGPRGIYL